MIAASSVRYAVAASLLVTASAAATADDPVVQVHPPVAVAPMAGVDTRGAALLMAVPDSGAVDGAVTWTLTDVLGGEDRLALTYVVEIDGEGLLVGSPPGPVTIEVVAYLLDDGGGLTAHVAGEVVLDSTDDRERMLDAGLKHRGGFSMEHGRYSLRLLVRNRATGRYCLLRRDLDVESDDAGEPVVSPVTVIEPTDRWFRTFQPAPGAEEMGEDPAEPRLWPSARPAWRTDQPLPVLVTGSAVEDGQQLAVRIEDRQGRVVREPAIRLRSMTAVGSGPEVVEAEVEAPGLPAGAYRLVVTAGGEDRTIAGTLPVWIHERPEQLVWTDLTDVKVETEKLDASTDGAQPGATGETAADAGEPPASPYPGVTPAERFTGAPVVALQIAGVDARGAALLMSGQSGGEIEGAVTWTVPDDAVRTDGVALRVVVEVDGRTLLRGATARPVPVEIVVYVFDDENRLVAHVASGVVLGADDEIAGVLGSGLKHLAGLTVPEGRCSLRVLVRNRASGRYFLQRRDFDLAPGASDAPVLLPPIVAEPTDRWVKTIQPDLETELQGRATDPRAWPSARPAWRSDQPLAVMVAGSAVADGRPIAARLEDRLGHSLLEPRLRVEAPTMTGSRLAFVEGEVEAPDLPAGEYRLVMFVSDRPEDRSTDRWLWVSVHDRAEEVAWTDLMDRTSEMDAPVMVATDGPSRGEIAHESMRTAYRAALLEWAADDRVSARRIVSELERPIAESEGTRGWRQLVAAEGSVLSELSARQPGVLVAAVLLHRDMYQWYLARGEGALARHSWESAANLALEAEDLDDWQPPDGFTEGLLLDLADRLVQSRQPHAARQLLEKAADIAPMSPRPLLALGALAERSGLPEEAIPPLKRLVELEPDDLEARLRLAVCLARDDQAEDAEELLEGLLAPTVTPWIRTLAYQEIGQLLIDTGRPARAVELLLDATSELPDNQRMRILLAYALDANGQPHQAASVLEGVDWLRTGDEESPRYRYSRWPGLDHSHTLEVLAAAESIGREALREATS